MATDHAPSSWCAHLRLLACSLPLAFGACGGQSGNEGEPSAPPCAGQQSLLVGRIEELAGGCVGVRVERVVAAGQPVFGTSASPLFDGSMASGKLVRGHLGSVYAYEHDFEISESVATLIESRGNELALQLFPLQDERVLVQWGRQQLQVDLAVMSAPDCAEKLEMQREATTDVVSQSRQSGTTPPAAPSISCAP